MPERAAAGAWVELHRVLLPPGARAPQVPADTQAAPLELRVKGILLDDATVGADATIRTAAGRVVTGRLETVEPATLHSFGPPEPALRTVGAELRAFLGRRHRPDGDLLVPPPAAEIEAQQHRGNGRHR
jgi:2-amino-4-ketopentanoate thiolase alpha subunit